MTLIYGSAVRDSFRNSSGRSVSHALDNNDNRIVIGQISTGTGATITGMKYNGVAMTLLSAETYNSTVVKTYYMLDAALPQAAGTYSCSGSMSDIARGVIMVMSFSGVVQAAPVKTSSNTAALTVATTLANSWILGFLALSNSDPFSFTSPNSTIRASYSDSGISFDSGLCATTLDTAAAGSYVTTISSPTMGSPIHTGLVLKEVPNSNFLAFF